MAPDAMDPRRLHDDAIQREGERLVEWARQNAEREAARPRVIRIDRSDGTRAVLSTTPDGNMVLDLYGAPPIGGCDAVLAMAEQEEQEWRRRHSPHTAIDPSQEKAMRKLHRQQVEDAMAQLGLVEKEAK